MHRPSSNMHIHSSQDAQCCPTEETQERLVPTGTESCSLDSRCCQKLIQHTLTHSPTYTYTQAYMHTANMERAEQSLFLWSIVPARCHWVLTESHHCWRPVCGSVCNSLCMYVHTFLVLQHGCLNMSPCMFSYVCIHTVLCVYTTFKAACEQ